MLLFNQRQDHVILSFLSGHVLFMNAQTRKPEACLSMGKNVHAVWSTADQKMAVAANIAEKTFIETWTDCAAHKFSFDPEKDVVNLDMSNLPQSVSAKLISQRDQQYSDPQGMATVG